MAIKEELIKTLIIQYDESIRLQSKLLDCGFAEALLNVIPVNIKNREALEALLDKRIDECEQLEKYLEIARDEVSKLFAKHEANTELKEFLDFAFSLSTVYDSDEDFDVEENSEVKSLSQHHDVLSKDELVGESNRNDIDNYHESEEVGLQFYEMTINLMSKLSIGNKLNSDVSDEISSISRNSNQQSTSTSTDLLDSTITSYKDLLECDTCGKCFLMKKNIILHMREHMKSEISSLCCNICRRKFSKKSNLQAHMRQVHHEEKKFECTECGKRFDKKHLMKLHTLLVHNRRLEKADDFTVESPSKISSLDDDIRSSKLSNKRKIQTTLPRMNFNEKPYECTKCGERFSRKDCIERHTAMHGWKKSYKCSFCDMVFLRKLHKKKHELSVHKEKSFECSECGLRLATDSNLKEHMEAHALPPKPFKCSVCDVGFKLLGERNRHERMVHEGGMLCAHCGRRFCRKTTLLSHIHAKHFTNSHLQFKCKSCKKSFGSKRHLLSHKLTHTSQKSFKCSVCDRSYKFDSSRLYHEKRDHGKGHRFPCKQCEKGYWHEASLIRHVRETH